MTERAIVVLLVEDDAADVELTREAMKEGKLFVDLKVVEDGIEALQYLRREGPYADAEAPDLVLLDLNLPRKDGRAVLAELRADEALKHLPVVVLTTSDSATDILRSYKLGCNCYITKPVGFQQFIEVVRTIDQFWFTVVRLPPRAGC
ncbi:MAG: response regulator [Elusimicrobia bacterium]|nr:response regulator [Elusimicrobiota bacterium]